MKLTGIKSGAVLQRVNGFSETVIRAECMGTLTCSPGKLEKLSEDGWLFSGLPAGGPYEVTFSDDESVETFRNVYVGDLWLLAGQSNMEGAGWLREKDAEYAKSPDSAVRAFYMEYAWREALPLLHQLWKSPDPAHQKAFREHKADVSARGLHVADFPPAPQKRGVGPGFFFARQMYRLTGVPQGVIPAAVGGAPIDLWQPTETGDNYCTAAVNRVKACGSRICGIFWYQGEGESRTEDYTRLFENMRQGFSSLCGTKSLPAVMVQPFRCTIPDALNSPASERTWSRYRAHLIRMTKELSSLSVVATNDLQLDDCIHLSSDAQELLGKRAADAMLCLTEGTGCGEPEIESMEIVPHACVTEWSELVIRYQNLRGNLVSTGFPSGFMISEGDEIPSEGFMQHISLLGNEVRIRFELTREQLLRKDLWYGFGHRFHCSIADEGGHAPLSFGPLPIGMSVEERT